MTSFNVQEFRAALRRADDAPLRANAPLAVALGGVACLAGFLLVGPLVSEGAADDTGVMAFLLGESRPAAPAPRVRPVAYYPERVAVRHDIHAGRYVAHPAPRMHAAIHRAPHARPAIARKAPPSIVALVTPPPRPAVIHSVSVSPLTDTTLRRGDAVMTTKGLRIFQGARRYPFTAGDFRSLAYAGKVAHRGALLAIDRVIREPSWSASFMPVSTPLSPVAVISASRVEAQAAVRVIEAERRS